MSYDTNVIVISGRLTADPQVAKMNNGKGMSYFSIASNQGKDNVSYFNVNAFGNIGEICLKYLQKGSAICVSGRITMDSYTDKQGNNKLTPKITANSVQFLSSKGDAGSRQQPATNNNQSQDPFDQVNFENQEEIPF